MTIENDKENTLFSNLECDDTADLMQKKYAAYLNDRTFEISTSEDGPGVAVKVVLKNDDNSFYYPVEARIDCEREEMTIRAATLFLIDYIDLYFEEYLTEDDNLFVPIDWTPFNYDAVDFQLKGQILNLKVEAMADQLLNEQAPLN